MSDNNFDPTLHDVIAGSIKNLSEKMAEQYDKSMFNRLWPMMNKCHMCSISQSFHESKAGQKMDHPFVKDNLDYLKWRHEQKQALQSEPKGDIITFKHENPNKDIK